MSLFKNVHLFKEIWSNFRGSWLKDDVSRNLTLQHHVKPQENLSGNTNVHSSTTSSNVGFSPNLQQREEWVSFFLGGGAPEMFKDVFWL